MAVIKFKYDPALVDAVKQLPQRRFDPRSKAWIVQPTQCLDTFLKSNGFAVHPELEVALDKERRIAQLNDKARQHRDDDQDADIPITKTKPWRHQRRAYHFAEHMRASLLYCGMGTGKSKVVVDVVQNSDMTNILIVCPKSVVPVWKTQFRIHYAERGKSATVYLIEKGTSKVKATQIRNIINRNALPEKQRIVVINYDSYWRPGIKEALLAVKWDLIVLDEGHRIKAPGGRASRFAQRVGVKARKRMALTGTPLPHSPLDAYGLFRFLDSTIYGTSFNRFKNRYAVMGGFGNYQVLGFQNQDEFSELFNSITFKATRDVLELPEVLHDYRTLEMNGDARKTYDQIENTFYAQIDSGEITVSNALVKLLRLQQITGGFVKDDNGIEQELHTIKQKALAEYLGDLPQDEPVVVFCRFKADLRSVHKAADRTERTSSELSGSRRELEDWQEGKTDVLACQIGSGAEGIDLTRAHYCVYFSLGFSLGQYEQSLARIHRPGQDRPVYYMHLLVEKSIDQHVYKLLRQRKNVVEGIVNRAGT
jgi:SNF2 family DNA or RNA helicase